MIDSIARLKAAELPLTVSVTPSRFTTKGKELIRLLYDLNIPFSINAGLKTPREETGRSLWDASLDTYVELYRENRLLSGGKPLPDLPDEDLPDPGGSVWENTGSEKGVTCAAGRSSFCLTWEGKLKPCNSFPGIEADALKLGFMEAWRQISAQVQEVPRPAECQACPYEKICNRCIVEHLEYGNPGHANPDVCARVRRLVKEGFIQL